MTDEKLRHMADQHQDARPAGNRRGTAETARQPDAGQPNGSPPRG
jgi:hypothetical protein